MFPLAASLRRLHVPFCCQVAELDAFIGFRIILSVAVPASDAHEAFEQASIKSAFPLLSLSLQGSRINKFSCKPAGPHGKRVDAHDAGSPPLCKYQLPLSTINTTLRSRSSSLFRQFIMGSRGRLSRTSGEKLCKWSKSTEHLSRV